MCEIGSLNLVADVQSIVMEACKERGGERKDEERRGRKRWGNSVLWWQRFRVAKGGYQRVEAAGGGREGGGAERTVASPRTMSCRYF